MRGRLIPHNPISPSDDRDHGYEAVSVLTIVATVLFALVLLAVLYFSFVALQ